MGRPLCRPGLYQSGTQQEEENEYPDLTPSLPTPAALPPKQKPEGSGAPCGFHPMHPHRTASSSRSRAEDGGHDPAPRYSHSQHRGGYLGLGCLRSAEAWGRGPRPGLCSRRPPGPRSRGKAAHVPALGLHPQLIQHLHIPSFLPHSHPLPCPASIICKNLTGPLPMTRQAAGVMWRM